MERKTDQTEKNSAGPENRVQNILTDDELLLIEGWTNLKSPPRFGNHEKKTATRLPTLPLMTKKLSPFEAAI